MSEYWPHFQRKRILANKNPIVITTDGWLTEASAAESWRGNWNTGGIDNSFLKAVSFIVTRPVSNYAGAEKRSAEFGRGLAHYIHRKYTSKSPLRNVPYILLGHSLGANIIFHCLEELYNLCKNDPTFGDGASCPIIEVHLLGGVPRAHDDDTWRRCVRVVRERICNYHSSGDEVLRVLPGPRIGRHPIQVGHGRILNVTAPEVKSHILWKSDLDVDRVLDKTTVSGYLVKKVQCDTTQASSDCKLREMEREFRERAREIDDVLLYLKQVAVELGEAA